MSGRNEVIITGAAVSTSSPTAHLNSTNASQSIPDANKYRDGASEGKAVAIMISVETNPIRVAWGTAPVPATPVGHVIQPGGDPILLSSWSQINQFRFISENSGAHADLNVTPFF